MKVTVKRRLIFYEKERKRKEGTKEGGRKGGREKGREGGNIRVRLVTPWDVSQQC